MYPETMGGAQVVGLDENIGSLTSGKLANVIALDLSILHAKIHAETALVDLPNLLTRGRSHQAITHVWVAGNARFSNRQIQV